LLITDHQMFIKFLKIPNLK